MMIDYDQEHITNESCRRRRRLLEPKKMLQLWEMFNVIIIIYRRIHQMDGPRRYAVYDRISRQQKQSKQKPNLPI